MSIKIGDQVRFLNSVGGGVITAFRGKDQVLVEDEDGFEVPALIRECVVVGSNNIQVKSDNRPVITKPVEKQAPADIRNEPEVVKIVETPGGERLNAFLAYLPVDPKAMQQTGYEAYFINNSNYYLFFNYMNRENNSWYSRFQGLIEPNTKIFLEEFEKSDLNALERICVQLIAYKKDKPYTLKNTVSVELRLDTVKFYKLHCFTENDFFDEGVLLFPIIREDVPEREMLVSAAELQEAMLQKKITDISVSPAEKKPRERIGGQIIEVDLHIHKLLDDTAGLDNADMLKYQLDKFHEVLAQYARKKGQKIVFIHGKGEGVLRNAIEKELRTRYKNYYFQDASFREYGYGATMVTIK